MTQTGFKLTFPSGTEFVGKKDIKIQYRTETKPLFQGGQQAAALWERYIDTGGTPSRQDSQHQTFSISIGAGLSRWVITFAQFKGSSDSWAGLASSASARKKLDYLHDAINTEAVDSRQPITLETGHFSTSGDFAPANVMVEQSDLTLDFGEDGPSSFSGQLTLIHLADEAQDIDNQFRKTGR